MPSSMLHLITAKKVNPNAGIDFYVGNLAPDAIRERELKDAVHFRSTKDREDALKEFAIKADNEYLKGVLLHLFVDWKWDKTWVVDYFSRNGDKRLSSYHDEIGVMSASAFHNNKWAHGLWKQLEAWDGNGFVEIAHIHKDNIIDMIQHVHKWHTANNIGPSVVFPPDLVGKFATDTANDFVRWCFFMKTNLLR